MSTIDEIERSVQDGYAIEFFVISINNGVTTYRHTTGTQDHVENGVTYTAIAAGRDEIAIPGISVEAGLQFRLPIDHAFCKRYVMQGVPPGIATINWYRRLGDETRLEWSGEITSANVDGAVMTFYAPPRAMEAVQRSLPTVSAGRECLHILYDSNCGVDRNSFKVTTTVLAIDGRTITVDISNTNNDGWAQHGEVVHVSSGERRTVRDQEDLDPGVSPVVRLELHVQIPELKVGDSVEIYAGCNHSMAQCVSRFDNRQRYGGFNRMPVQNAFLFTNKGTRSTGEL